MKIAPAIALVILSIASPAVAQDGTFATSIAELAGSEGGSWSGRVIQMIGLLTVLSLAPGILLMVTSFTRIVIVLSLLRMAMGLHNTPPNVVIISLAMFMTAFIMQPTFTKAWETGLYPLLNDQITEEQAVERMSEPFRGFMMQHVRDKDLALFRQVAADADEASGLEPGVATEVVPWQQLVPAFMLSELRRAFEMGFYVFMPFLVIDMFVASVLMSMGMMMLPPIMIALPFKILFFVLIDGWHRLVGSLIHSFGI